jgi:hypothetical protein
MSSYSQDDEPDMFVNIVCFFGALLISAIGLAILIFALAGAQALLNKSRKGRAIGISAVLGSAVPLALFIFSRIPK